MTGHRHRHTERAAAEIVKTILNVVQVCHQHGVMHRDLKPENFLFSGKDENETLKAIDFGLSVFFEQGQCFNEIVGSPYYMAPEVLRRNYGLKADIRSAGVILYILLCGVPPFWAETEEGITHAIVRGVIFKGIPLVLAWEDAFYHKHTKHDPCGSRCHGGIQSLHEGSSSQDPLGLAVAKMANHVYSLGEGIVGQVAVRGKHHWILADEHPANSLLSPETLVVAVVLPHGVVQLGSMNKVD